MMSPDFMVGITPSYRCKSEPQIAVEVTLITASRGLIISGSATLSTRTSCFPCHVNARMINPPRRHYGGVRWRFLRFPSASSGVSDHVAPQYPALSERLWPPCGPIVLREDHRRWSPQPKIGRASCREGG